MTVLQNKENGSLLLLTKLNVQKGTYTVVSGGLTMKFKARVPALLLTSIRSKYKVLGLL